MKKIKIAITLALFIGMVSCKKTDNSTAAAITTDQVADITSGALGVSTTGLSTNFDDMAVNAQSVSSISGPAKTINGTSGPGLPGPQCGIMLTDSVAKTGTSNAIAFSYFLNYTHTLGCDIDDQAASLTYNLAFHGNYSGPNISAIDTGSSSFIITGFTTGSSVFSINGTYNRKGAFTSKVGNKISGTSLITIFVTNLTITKSTRVIAGGTATISVTIKVPKGTFSYNGSLKFNGDNTATFTVSGAVYSINLLTGAKTKQ